MKKGFTLPETLFGIVILGLLMVVVCGVFIKGLAASKKSGKKVTGLILASTMLDNIILMKYSNIHEGVFDGTIPSPCITNPDTSVFPPPPYPYERDASGNKVNYFYRVEVKPYGGSGRLKRVIVTLISKGIKGEGNTSITLETLKMQ